MASFNTDHQHYSLFLLLSYVVFLETFLTFSFISQLFPYCLHCGKSVSGTAATPKYLRPFFSFFFSGNQNPVKSQYDVTILFFFKCSSTMESILNSIVLLTYLEHGHTARLSLGTCHSHGIPREQLASHPG